MKITFLGTGTSTGIPTIGIDRPVCKSDNSKDIRLRSSILINVNQKNILVDCSPDFRQQMLKNNFSKIDAILFTHEHSDHTAGLDDVRPISFRYGKIPLFGKKRVLKKLNKRFDYLFDDSGSYTGSPHVYSNNVKKNKDFHIDDLVFKPISYMHHKLQVFGYRLFNFAYITDLKTIKTKELEKLTNLDCLVLNALRHRDHYSHINLNQALKIIEILKPKTAYLTHIAPDMGFHDETEKLLPKNVYLAYDGLQIQVD